MSHPTHCTIHLISANLSRLLGPHISDAVVAAARGFLRREGSAKRLRGFWVMGFGDDLHLHLVTHTADFPDADSRAFAANLGRQAALAALEEGRTLGMAGKLTKVNPRQINPA